MTDEVYLHGAFADETDLAIAYIPIGEKECVWIPRSQCSYIHKGPRSPGKQQQLTICCSAWIAKQNNLPISDTSTYPKS